MSRAIHPHVPVLGGCARIAIDADPGALLPYATASAASSDIQGFLFHQLFELDADLSTFSPRLAETSRWEDDSRSLVVRLRPGLRWSDGAPLDAEDVRFSYELACDPRLQWYGAAWKTRLTGCEVEDRLTLRFRFESQYPDQMMDANTGFIVPRHQLAAIDRDCWAEAAGDPQHPLAGAIVGNGPFRLAAREPGKRVVLERNPYYHEPGRPRLDRVEFIVLKDARERMQALRAGEVDLLAQVPEADATQLREAYAEGTSDVRILSIRGRQYDFVCYSPRHPALGDREVRRALTLAVDRQAIIQTFCSGFAEPFESPIVPILWAHDATRPITPYDPGAARAVLDRAGWRIAPGAAGETDGIRAKGGVALEFELVTNAESVRRAGTARLLAEYWRVIGARVQVRLCERTELLRELDSRRFDAALSGWRARLKPDLGSMWGCASVGSKTNRVDYCNPDVDRLNDAALRAPDLEEARRLFAAAQRIVADDYPYTWLYYLHDVVGVRECLRDATIDARGVFLNPQDWWRDPQASRPRDP